MDSTENSPVKAGGWTTEEKYTLLLKIIAQFTIDKPIKWAEIDMPGRSPKALMHVWAKIKSESGEFDKAKAEATEAATPATPANTRSRKNKKAAGGGDEGEALDEGNGTPTKKAKATPKKKTPKAKKGESSKSEAVAKEEVDEDVKDEDVTMEENVKEEPVKEDGDDTEV